MAIWQLMITTGTLFFFIPCGSDSDLLFFPSASVALPDKLSLRGFQYTIGSDCMGMDGLLLDSDYLMESRFTERGESTGSRQSTK